jgi:hypothetical protein
MSNHAYISRPLKDPSEERNERISSPNFSPTIFWNNYEIMKEL